jgi:hypothetical protein
VRVRPSQHEVGGPGGSGMGTGGCEALAACHVVAPWAVRQKMAVEDQAALGSAHLRPKRLAPDDLPAWAFKHPTSARSWSRLRTQDPSPAIGERHRS